EAAINEIVDIVGSTLVDLQHVHAVLYADGILHDLGTLGGQSSFATGIDQEGRVIGESTTAEGESRSHGFLWENGAMRDLDPFLISGNKKAKSCSRMAGSVRLPDGSIH